jgi:hypothetical protein
MSQIGIIQDLDEDEKVLHESFICDIEFEKQEDFIRDLLGEKIKGRVVCKPYLTNNRILMWLLVVPEKGKIEPKSIWYSFPYERINYMRPGRKGKRYKKKGLELEFAALKVGGTVAGLGQKMMKKGGITGWVGGRLGKEKTKLWLYVPDSPVWNLKITEILRGKGIV